MSTQGFKTSGGDLYVYQESASGASIAYGYDHTTSQVKIKAQATAGATPTGTAHINIDPTTGHIVFTPNGAGKISALNVANNAVAYANRQLVTINSATGELGSSAAPLYWLTEPLNSTLLVANYGHILTNVGMTTALLPATCAVGSTIRIYGSTAGLFTISQNGLPNPQNIRIGNQITASGLPGSLVSTAIGDSIELLCIVADVSFVVISSVGNFTINL